jgi:hypothetical protein
MEQKMELIKIKEETALIFDVQYGVVLEERASALTQGGKLGQPEYGGGGRFHI